MARRKHGTRTHGIGGVTYKKNKGHHGGVGLDHSKNARHKGRRAKRK